MSVRRCELSISVPPPPKDPKFPLLHVDVGYFLADGGSPDAGPMCKRQHRSTRSGTPTGLPPSFKTAYVDWYDLLLNAELDYIII